MKSKQVALFTVLWAVGVSCLPAQTWKGTVA